MVDNNALQLEYEDYVVHNETESLVNIDLKVPRFETMLTTRISVDLAVAQCDEPTRSPMSSEIKNLKGLQDFYTVVVSVPTPHQNQAQIEQGSTQSQQRQQEDSSRSVSVHSCVIMAQKILAAFVVLGLIMRFDFAM